MVADRPIPNVEAPDVIVRRAGYDFIFNDEGVMAEVRRLQQFKDGIHGEVTISYKRVSSWEHVRQSSFNLSAGIITRNREAKDLDDQLKGIKWGAVLEHISRETLRLYRTGSPVKPIRAHAAELKPPEYLLEPFIINGMPNVIFGDPNSGKSLSSVIMAVLCALPWEDNPLKWKVPTRPVNTLILDWEGDEDTANWGIRRVLWGAEIKDDPPIFYRHCDRTLAQDIDQIIECIDQCGAELTIIDSLGLAAGGDLNATQPALDFWSSWRRLKTTSLIIAHNPKGISDGQQKSIFGSMFFTAGARNIWEVKSDSTAGQPRLKIAFTHRKTSPLDTLRAQVGFKAEYSALGPLADQVFLSSCTGDDMTAFLEELSTNRRIKKLLEGGPKKSADMALSLGISVSTVKVAMSRLKDKKEVVSLGNGLWGLVGFAKNFASEEGFGYG